MIISVVIIIGIVIAFSNVKAHVIHIITILVVVQCIAGIFYNQYCQNTCYGLVNMFPSVVASYFNTLIHVS